MCLECGCGQGGPVKVGKEKHTNALSHASEHHPHHDHHHHEHEDEHNHDHSHAHVKGSGPGPHVVPVHEAILAKNDRMAERNRGYFKAKGLLVLNMVSAPGSGKTALIQATAAQLAGRLRTGVIVGDLATDNDATRLRAAGVPVIQITTGTVCHLEAEMVSRAMAQMDLDHLDLLIIENVGNLVCPAVYDLGEDLRVVLLSSTEGEDKPLKYPPMFHSADVAIVSKTDLAAPAGFALEEALDNLRRIAHHATVFQVSSRTGQGMEAWCNYLLDRYRQATDNSQADKLGLA